MRGIVAWGAYLPYRRLDRSTIAAVAGQSGGRGTRTVAGHDEDPTTMAVEAARLALSTTKSVPNLALFGATNPAYADRTNATALHAALRLPSSTPAFDLGSSTRSCVGGLMMASCGYGTTLVASADIRGGLAGSAEEANGGDAAASFIVGDDTAEAPVVAEFVASASATEEFIDRWRTPGESRSKVWDDKFAEVTYVALGLQAWSAALASAELGADDIAAIAVSAPSERIAKSMASKVVGGASSVAGGASNITAVDDFALRNRVSCLLTYSNRASPARPLPSSASPTVPT
jgi:hydroxymethylglutaryl-CoA synthase